MPTLQEYSARVQLRYLHPLGKHEEKIALCETADGEYRVLRRYREEDAPCRALLQTEVSQLVRVYDCQNVDGETLSVEEYIDGVCLSQILRERLLSPAQAAAIARELCLALQALHDCGLVYRDVKPENVMLEKSGRVVLIDLDAAALLDGTTDTNTTLLGTAGYAAPEQFGFSRCDIRADIFALGVLMNVVLTGEHPSVQLAGGRFRKIIQRCIRTNADQRYADVQAVLRALPAAKPPRECPLCGAMSPGGGCIWCGGAAKPKKNRARTALVLSVVSIFISLATLGAGVFGLLSYPASDEQPTMQTDEQETEAAATPDLTQPLTRLTPEPLEISGAYPKSELPYNVPFQYDLDADGTAETYYFAVARIFPGTSNVSCTTGGSRFVTEGEACDEFFAPIICRQSVDGGFEAVPELVGLIEDAEMQVYYLGEPAQEPLTVETLPDAQNGVWEHAIHVTVTVENYGTWYYSCRATLGGETVESGLRITYEENIWDE